MPIPHLPSRCPLREKMKDQQMLHYRIWVRSVNLPCCRRENVLLDVFHAVNWQILRLAIIRVIRKFDAKKWVFRNDLHDRVHFSLFHFLQLIKPYKDSLRQLKLIKLFNQKKETSYLD